MGIETAIGLGISAAGTIGGLVGGGGGSSTQSVTSTPDPMAQAFDIMKTNLMLPQIAEAGTRSGVYDQFYQDNYLPAEKEYLGAYRRMLPGYEALSNAQLEAQLALMPAATDLDYQQLQAQSELLGPATQLGLEQIGAAREKLGPQTALDIDRIGGERALLPEATNTIGSFLNASTEGVDPAEWRQRAGVDAQQGLSQAVGQMNRNASRMGLNPGSGAFTNAMKDTYLQGAANKAGAMTDAWRKAEDENYRRLGLGAQVGAQTFGLSGS